MRQIEEGQIYSFSLPEGSFTFLVSDVSEKLIELQSLSDPAETALLSSSLFKRYLLDQTCRLLQGEPSKAWMPSSFNGGNNAPSDKAWL